MAVPSHCAESLKLSGNLRVRPKGGERKEQRRGSHGAAPRNEQGRSATSGEGWREGVASRDRGRQTGGRWHTLYDGWTRYRDNGPSVAGTRNTRGNRDSGSETRDRSGPTR